MTTQIPAGQSAAHFSQGFGVEIRIPADADVGRHRYRPRSAGSTAPRFSRVNSFGMHPHKDDENPDLHSRR